MLEQWMLRLGYGLCHQLPERSFFAGGYQVPVCARDTGIYVGFALSLLVLALLSRGRRPSNMPAPAVLVFVGAAIGLLAWDGLTSYAGVRNTTNEIRLATGLLMGYALPALLVPLMNGQLWRRPDATRVPDGARETVIWLVPLPLAYALVLWALPFLGLVYPLLVSAAIIVTFVTANLAIVSLLPFAEGRAERLRDLIPALVVAVLLAAAEIAGAAWLRAYVTGLPPGRR